MPRHCRYAMFYTVLLVIIGKFTDSFGFGPAFRWADVGWALLWVLVLTQTTLAVLFWTLRWASDGKHPANYFAWLDERI